MDFKNQRELFLYIWDNYLHQSYLSQRPLIYGPFHDFFWSQFAHVLPKKRYPRFKLKIGNIVLVTPTEHRMYDQGTEKERKKHPECDWCKLDALKQQLKREYRGL